ncbi:TonB-dependent receptor [Marinirhabdus gelatinilytica]|uniref:Iron complex outermembrane receptor protein n=1 Tax=Marinirhabdus gelatinilytica TaxID=1703343 RepID=A0A370QAJ4_9FLAO|nr:TonB-dependent receptor [Marinirhabdus gelatinilytica]RDK85391.1 iron complex outermembrane receptor protein [Marinirhabdus gelatinilytica]
MKLPFMLLLALASTGAISQNCDLTLTGEIIDLHDSSTLSGATIIIAETEDAVVSNLDGSFTISGLCPGTYNVQVSHPECATRAFSFEISENTSRTFRLEHHLEELNQIIVKGSSYVTKTETLLENRIETETLESFSNASLGDALKTISGVSSLNTGNAVVKPVINGLHSSRITIVNNGVRQQDQEWGAEHAPNIDLNTAGSITVLKGASALQFSGDAIGGVVVSEPARVAIKDSLYGKTLLSAQTNGRGATFTTVLTKSFSSGFYSTVQGTLKQYGDFEAPDYVLTNTGTEERDFSVNVGINKIKYGLEGYYSYFENTLGILRASHVGGAQDQVAAINSDTPLVIRDFTYNIDVPRQEVTHHLAKLSGFVQLDNVGKLSLQYDFQQNNRFEFDVTRIDDGIPSVDLELTTHNLMLSLESDLSGKTSTKFGLVGNFQENFANPATGVRRLIPDYEQYKLAAFGIADTQLTEKLTAELGFRFDYTYMDTFKFYRTSFWEARGYDEQFPELVVEEFNNQILTNPELDFGTISATAGISYQLSKDYFLFANYSLASRAPNPSELFSEGLHHSASRIELGDLRFGPEISQKITSALQKKGSDFSFSINPYANFIEDFILIEPTGIEQTIRGNFQVWEYRQTSARLLGVDTDLQYKLTEDLHYSNQFSLVKGWDRTRDQALINMPPANLVNGITYVLPWKTPVSIGLDSNYVFEQNEFPDNNFEVFIPETDSFETVDISTPPAAYHLIGLRASTVFNIHKNNKLKLNVNVSNLFNTSYRDYLNRLRYYADDLGRNITLQLKFNY